MDMIVNTHDYVVRARNNVRFLDLALMVGQLRCVLDALDHFDRFVVVHVLESAMRGSYVLLIQGFRFEVSKALDNYNRDRREVLFSPTTS